MGSAWVARHGLTSGEYQAAFDKWVGEGYRIANVSGHAVGNETRYAAIWEKTDGPAWVAHHGLTSAQYQAEFNHWVGQGYRLVGISGYAPGGEDRYAAIWEKSDGPAWVARHGLSAAEYQVEFDKWVGQGYRPLKVSGHGAGSAARYAAIWEKSAGPSRVTRHELTSAQYQVEFDKWAGQGYRLLLISGFTVGGEDRYAPIWEQSMISSWASGHGLSSMQYQTEFDSWRYQGYRPKLVSGYGETSSRYGAIWQSDAMKDADLGLIDSKISAYMSPRNIPGLSIAITRNERLVFAKGYGYADTTIQEKITPASVFRIASISKPITAVGIITLLESPTYQLNLDAEVFGSGALLGTQYGMKSYSNDVKSITVRHLLQHTSGWSNDGGDPMFMNPSMNHAELIGWVLDNRASKNSPGSTYEYLNFGYCVLGRIIETVTGQTYEQYIKGAVLDKCGVTRMQIGAETHAAKAPGEVTYYGSAAYSLKTKRMDAHGGWIATPIDLLKFMARTDGFASKVDVLTAVDEATMFAGTNANTSYGMGWMVSNEYRGHNGAMPGSMGFLVRRSDGFSFAVLANTRPGDDAFCFTLKAVLDDIVGSVSSWPGYDLF